MRIITLIYFFIFSICCCSAQINFFEDFDDAPTNTLPAGWSTNNAYFSTTTQSCFGKSVRDNLLASSPEGYLIAPFIGSLSSGTPISFQFDYKVLDYFDFGTPDAAESGWGTLTAEFTIDNGETYQEILVIDETNYIQNSSCQTINAVIPGESVPSGADFQIRFRGNWQEGDVFVYIDNVIVNQIVFSVPPCDAVLVSPENGEIDANLDGEISWSTASAGTVAYRFSMGTSPGATDIADEEVVSGGATSYSAGQLEEGTTYYLSIVPFNSLGNAVGCTEYSFTTGFSPCEAPSDLTIDNITQTSVDIDWLENGSATSWLIQYGEESFDPNTEGESLIDNDSESQEIISNLEPNTNYDVYIKSYCSQNDSYSEFIGPVTFTTLAEIPTNDACETAIAISSFPFNSAMNANGATNNDGFITICGGLGMNDGVWYSFMGDGFEVTITVEELSSWNSEIGLYAGDCNNLTCIDSEDTLSNTQEIVFISQLGETYFVNIGASSGLLNLSEGSFSLNIETVGPPPCSDPSDMTFDNVNPYSALISWAENGEAESWEVIYGFSGFNPLIQGNSVIVEDDPQILISDLEPNTTYDVYVTSNCEFNNSEIVGPLSFTTAIPVCADPSDISVNEISTNSAMISWLENGEAEAWEVVYGLESFNPETEGILLSVNETPNVEISDLAANTAYDVYVKSICQFNESEFSLLETFTTLPPPCSQPSAVIIQNIESDSAQISWSSPENDQWEVIYGLTGFNPETEGELILVENTQTVNLTDLVSNSVYDVYIRSICDSNESEYLGPISFTTQTQICADPTAITISEITENSAYISWTENGAATQWSIVFGPLGFDPETEGEEIIDNDGVLGETISNLTENTVYEVYIYAICSESVSNVSAPEEFETASLSLTTDQFKQFQYYPTPVSSSINLKAVNTISKIEIYSITGKKIFAEKIQKLQHQIDLSSVVSGIYLMNVTIGESLKTYKLIKK